MGKVVDVEFEETAEVEAKEENIEGQETTKESKFLNFITDNPGMIIPLVTGFTMLFKGLFSFVMSAGGNNTYRVQDDVTGLDFTTRHALTNSEILELGDRKSNGQSTGEALDDMGLLKNERKRK